LVVIITDVLTEFYCCNTPSVFTPSVLGGFVRLFSWCWMVFLLFLSNS